MNGRATSIVLVLCLISVTIGHVSGERYTKSGTKRLRSQATTTTVSDVIESGESREETDEDFDFDEEDNEFDSNDKDTEATLRSMYNAWNNLDLCQDVTCKLSETCVVRSKGNAVCIRTPSPLKVADKGSKKGSRKGEASGVRHDESGKSGNRKKNKVRLESSSCRPCPVVRPEFVCGSDNSTYSTLCRLDYHNCVHMTQTEVACKGFCPCKTSHRSPLSEKWDKSGHKYQRTLGQEKTKKRKLDTNATPKNRKYQNDVNSVLPPPKSEHKRKNSVPKGHVCTKNELKVMGERLLDWFTVVLTDRKRKERRQGKEALKMPDCKKEIGWMFHHLDIDGDMSLSLKELYDLEHDRHEPCLKQYLDTCDEDKDSVLSGYEWCTCFDRKSSPCHTALAHSKKLLGAYVPQCDLGGFFQATQCHGSSGTCWCVDRNGVEFTNTRRRGRPDCEGMLSRARSKVTDHKDDNEIDDDDSDDDEDSDGSGDGQIDV